MLIVSSVVVFLSSCSGCGFASCSSSSLGETSEKRGGAHMGFSERIDTILTELKLTLPLFDMPQ